MRRSLRSLAPALALASALLSFLPFSHAQRAQLTRFEIEPVPGQKALVAYLDRGSDPLPILIALHGRGEAVRGPNRGYRGWLDDYALGDAMTALARGRLTKRDHRGFVRDEHLRSLNSSLRAQPYRGLVVVTPYTPDLMDEPFDSQSIVDYGNYLAGPLIEAVAERVPRAQRDKVGIDGVSLGGMLSLQIGFSHPDVFDTVGGIQPAIRGRVERLTAMARDASPRPTLRLLSSDEDPFLRVTRQLSSALEQAGYRHELVVTPGPHDYSFNRGPGSIELLRFHDRALR